MSKRRTHNIRTKVEMITPDKAKRYLKSNESNRTISNTLVQRLSRDMKAGKWELNGEAIVFSADGKLIDGQHRMTAVVKSGVTVPMLVVRGVNADARFTIDHGRARTAGDVLRMKGCDYNTLRASMARVILLMDRAASEPSYKRLVWTHKFMSDSEVVELAESLPLHKISIESTVSRDLYTSVGTKGNILGPLFWIGKKEGYSKRWRDFANRFLHMETVDFGVPETYCPAVMAHRSLLAAGVRARLFKGTRLNVEQIARVIVRSWKDFTKGVERTARYHISQPRC